MPTLLIVGNWFWRAFNKPRVCILAFILILLALKYKFSSSSTVNTLGCVINISLFFKEKIILTQFTCRGTICTIVRAVYKGRPLKYRIFKTPPLPPVRVRPNFQNHPLPRTSGFSNYYFYTLFFSNYIFSIIKC